MKSIFLSAVIPALFSTPCFADPQAVSREVPELGTHIFGVASGASFVATEGAVVDTPTVKGTIRKGDEFFFEGVELSYVCQKRAGDLSVHLKSGEWTAVGDCVTPDDNHHSGNIAWSKGAVLYFHASVPVTLEYDGHEIRCAGYPFVDASGDVTKCHAIPGETYDLVFRDETIHFTVPSSIYEAPLIRKSVSGSFIDSIGWAWSSYAGISSVRIQGTDVRIGVIGAKFNEKGETYEFTAAHATEFQVKGQKVWMDSVWNTRSLITLGEDGFYRVKEESGMDGILAKPLLTRDGVRILARKGADRKLCVASGWDHLFGVKSSHETIKVIGVERFYDLRKEKIVSVKNRSVDLFTDVSCSLTELRFKPE